MKTSVTKIGIFCDLSPLSGLGHIKRMISLNNSIEKSKEYSSESCWNKLSPYLTN